ncbi:serine/threonine-protein kinase Nek4 isoform X2 [Cuculus canorus]|uniref:serine/threonine-protein kinase Nek4 isoform X2 n=1 Tax=Cuculus canorus TaxID=55661 RepID=UPI0023AB29AE|nr:serine/threonine-protein kinase Nek4 isoform X2 [Cuculus canorus]
MPLAAYSFLRAVGKGSYGEVSLVRHQQDCKQYVIKKLNLKHASTRERKAAEQEAQLLSQLKHPNIVTYRESWQGEDGLLYIVMGFCEGGDLYHKLKEQKGKLLPENQVVEWFVQIAMALQYLHEKHILHRDLKTQNVFLTRTNIIKVGDLGIARVLENQYDMASTLIGTPYYMSPELFSHKPYNYKSDIWALGCCVYEMATLKHAFNAKDMNSLVYRIIEGKLPPMPKDYSPQLVEIIRTMLSKKPEERPSVKSILRQPYIKHQISLVLEATKAKAARSHKKTVNSKPKDPCSVVSGKTESHSSNITHENHSFEKPRKSKITEEDCVVKHKATKFCPSEKPAVELERKPSNNDLNNVGDSSATLSEVRIDIFPSERMKYGSEERSGERVPENNKAKNVNVPGKSKITSSSPLAKEDELQQRTNQAFKAENVESKQSSDDAVEEGDDTLKLLQPVSKDQKHNDLSLDSTEKLLAPFVPVIIQDDICPGALGDAQEKIASHLWPHSSVSEPSLSRQRRQKKSEPAGVSSEKFRAAAPRPLPFVSDANAKTTQSSAEQHGADASETVNGTKTSQVAISKERPLSARERRRLKQSQEEMFPSVIPARRASNSAVVEAKSHMENHVKVAQSSSDPSISQRETHCLSDDELSSSTSSTDKSDGDSKEKKSSMNEMNDLVRLMTWTLKMDSKKNKSCVTSTPASEFKLHRKYRDTLILHGKLPDESEELKFEEIPSDMLPIPDKIRRMVEILRSDVVQGLGVKLLEKVYSIMEEEDEVKRELQLRQHMGDKYASYSAKARHLKFLEENVKF